MIRSSPSGAGAPLGHDVQPHLARRELLQGPLAAHGAAAAAARRAPQGGHEKAQPRHRVAGHLLGLPSQAGGAKEIRPEGLERGAFRWLAAQLGEGDQLLEGLGSPESGELLGRGDRGA